MKKFKVFVLCICTVFALTVVLTACGQSTAEKAQPSIQTKAASEQPFSAQTEALASSSKAACGCN